jgi:pyruvate/2-oxoglutarate dehydrogenase complex dihydrolipoamide dehydrogenase (E3) component
MEHFDAIVIGSGQGGNPLAKAMAKHGWKTAVIERRYPGGTCVNDGCTPSKTIDSSARVAYLARRGADFGVITGPISIDMSTVYARKQEIVLKSRENNRKALAEAENSTLIMGEASFSTTQPTGGTHSIDVAVNDGGTRTLSAPRIFLNTGERPHIPAEIKGLTTIPYLDSTSIMELQTVPESLIVIGAGYIALEFADMFHRFGSSVTVLERGERLVPHEDDDVAQCLRGILEQDGIRIVTCSEVSQVTKTATGATLVVDTDDGPVTLEGTHVLVATGRTPNVEPLHLDRAGIQQDKSGHIQVNDKLETNIPGIWALGDIKGGPAFTHISYDDYRILNANLLESPNSRTRNTRDRQLPYCVFIDPQLGRIGLSEKDAAKRGIKVRVARLPMTYVARAMETSQSRGFMKALVHPETKQILGAAVLGLDGGEIMGMLQIAMLGKLPYPVLQSAVLAHPTLAESLNNLFRKFDDKQP